MDVEQSDAAGVPTTYGRPQRAADIEAQLLRGEDVHAPDTVIDHGTFGTLTVRAASVRGTYGRYHGSAREDDYALGSSTDDRWLLVAVADGLTSASAAHLAATLAARTAVQQACRALDETALHDLDLHGVFQSAAYQLRRSAERVLARDGQVPTTERIAGLMATTLVLAIVPSSPLERAVRVARVGDSNAWTLDGVGWQPAFPPKDQGDGVASGAVLALPRLPEVLEETTLFPAAGDVLVLTSDGVSDAFGVTLDSPVATDLHRAWRPTLPPPLEFARQLSFRGRSWDDDRTAVAVSGIWGPAVPPPPAIDLDRV